MSQAQHELSHHVSDEREKTQQYRQRLCEREQAIAKLDDQHKCMERELHSTEHSNKRLIEQGHFQQEEMSALRQYADLIAMQNKDLSVELEEFVRTEEMLKSSLDRRQ